jgi:RNA polymerase sigma factor (sigma-70 family)
MTIGAPVELGRPDVGTNEDGRNDLAEVRQLLRASDMEAREQAWEAFIARYSRLLLHIAGLVMPDQDGVMDAYAYTIEQLRQQDFRTLRGYVESDRCRFSTWLAVVARRSCVDFHRHRYGRLRPNDSALAAAERAARQRLMNLAGVALDLTQLPEPNGHGPERELRGVQLQHALDDSLARLPAEDRLLLKLRFEDDLPAQAIAPVIGLPSPFHVYRRIKAVCQQLRQLLKERGVEESAP